jgi:hypothetical protein
MSAVRLEAARRGLSAALLAELIGQESGFRNVRNEMAPGRKPASSAGGLGQQLAGNPFLHGRSRFNPEASIAATAEELADRLRAAHGNLEVAVRGYGLTAGLPAKARAAKLGALYRALAQPDELEALR